jgi:tetratricopeptide (TPR) repeat protein
MRVEGPMTDCEEIHALMAFRELSVLEDEELARVEAHEASCPACRRDATSLEAACRLVAEIGGKRRPPPANVWKEIARSLEKPLADEVDAERAVSAIRIALDCSYCHGKLGRTEAVYCASCLAPHHEECFREHRRCATYGCDETRLVRPQETAPARKEMAAPPRAKRRWRRGLLVLVGALGVGSVAALTMRAERSKNARNAGARAATKRRIVPAPAAPRCVHRPPRLEGLVYTDRIVLSYSASEENVNVTVDAARVERRTPGGDWQTVLDEYRATSPGAGEVVDTAPVASATYRYVETVRPESPDAFLPEETPAVQSATWTVPARPDEEWAKRGRKALAASQIDEADKDFSVAIALAPRIASSWLGRSETRLRYRNQKTEAFADLTKALQLDPRSPEAWLACARYHLDETGKLDEALEAANEAVKLAPRLAKAWEVHARVLDRQENAKGFQADLRRVLELEPKNAEVWSDLIGSEMDADATAALADTNRALEACGPACDLYYKRSFLDGDSARALDDVVKAIALKPDVDMLWVRRADLLTSARNWREAEEAATRAIGLHKANVRALKIRAEARLELGDVAGAILDADDVLDRTSGQLEDADRAEAYRIRGLALEKSGNVKGAISDLESYLHHVAEDHPRRSEVAAKLAELKKAPR